MLFRDGWLGYSRAMNYQKAELAQPFLTKLADLREIKEPPVDEL